VEEQLEGEKKGGGSGRGGAGEGSIGGGVMVVVDLVVK